MAAHRRRAAQGRGAHRHRLRRRARARFVLTGGFVCPQGTELRARSDRYGHLAALARRRQPTASPSRARCGRSSASAGSTSRRSPRRTSRRGRGRAPPQPAHAAGRASSTRAAKATLEVAALPDAGDGGALVCRLLLDLMGAPALDRGLRERRGAPARGAAMDDAGRARVRRDHDRQRRTDLAVQDLAAPPATVTFAGGPAAPRRARRWSGQARARALPQRPRSTCRRAAARRAGAASRRPGSSW